MTTATSTPDRPGALERGGSSLADVVETVLDKGLVIDAQVSVALVGIQLLEIDARVVVASVETYLRFAEAVDRLDITPDAKGLPELVDDAGHAVTKGKAASGIADTAKEIGGAFADSLRGSGSGEEPPRRQRDRERRHE